MNTWPHQDPTAMNAFYGNPDTNGDAAADARWEAQNIVAIAPPYRMVLAWSPAQPVTRIRCHHKVADSLLRSLTAIRDHYGAQAALEAARMHLYGGAHMFRPMRGRGHVLSIHSWGAAIDLDPEGNPFGGKVTMPPAVVSIFAAEGWVWGGPWSKPDGMHFQAARV